MREGLFRKGTFQIAGDCGLLVEYGAGINFEVNVKVRAMTKIINKNIPNGVVEVIPTYRSLLVVYDPGLTNPTKLKNILTLLEEQLDDIKIPTPVVVEIPVCYGGEFGPDISIVGKAYNLTEDDVIRLHSEPEYLIYMIGFTPGFAYLGDLPEKLQTPRLETPRTFVPEGSVGIANNQTGIYSVESPGGWQLIGRTPLKLFAPESSNPFLYQAGDKIKFKSISAEEFSELAGSKGS
ncbi:MAG: allophanate hydrolase subunit 1 [Bacteroidetes bacterium]|nr:MAG: allophanate hydrolase subunit 1 [Bacteroidota bacterium]